MLHSNLPATLKTPATQIRLGLRANWEQFALLVLVNAFVGGMVGIERAILPLLAQQEFGLASKTAILSFIVSFGLTKALANVAAGGLSDRLGRRRVLIAGWLAGLPAPILMLIAPDWSWVIAANILLGINQGLCWSSTVIMKIDLVGGSRRGLAMGLNEAAGYLAVALAALASGYLAAHYGLGPQPFYLGIAFALAGLALSIFAVRDTHRHVKEEQRLQFRDTGRAATAPARFREMFVLSSWKQPTLFAVNQAGLVNNLNDGMAWGLFPLFFGLAGLSLERISLLVALYPAVWGLAQMGTGPLSDRIGRKIPITAGMGLQGLAIMLLPLKNSFALWTAGMVLLGLGTALVYPTLLAAIGDAAEPGWRATAVGTYRFWRDIGYVVGALLAGSIADLLNLRWAIVAVGALTLMSALLVAVVMQETLPDEQH